MILRNILNFIIELIEDISKNFRKVYLNSNFYEKNYKFPMDKILQPGNPIRSFNIKSDTVDNSFNNNNVILSKERSLTNSKAESKNTDSEQVNIPVNESNKSNKSNK